MFSKEKKETVLTIVGKKEQPSLYYFYFWHIQWDQNCMNTEICTSSTG